MIRSQKILILATADPDPWCTPVYYYYAGRRFYFFSSPESRHIAAALTSGECAASIHRDVDDWRAIEGLQMEGRIQAVKASIEAARAFSGYVSKFPVVRDFFAGAEFDLAGFCLRFRARLYAFVPERLFYLKNTAGLGSRVPVQLPD